MDYIPRGIRNNNPGNIRKSQTLWLGESDVQTDPDFIQFKDPVYGLRAIARIMSSYQGKGINTIQLCIARWAPSNENDTQAYVMAVCKSIPCGPSDILDFKTVMPQLVKAIVQHENGQMPYTNDEISQGIMMAYVS